MRSHLSRGFTLIEVLVVIAIIALLTAILMPTLSKARQQGRRAVCAANFTNVGRAYFMYATDHRSVLPPSWSGGFFSVVFDFEKTYFDRRKLGGDVFMCPTFEPGAAPNGDPIDWDHPQQRTDRPASAIGNRAWVQTGYSFWTHFVRDPHDVDREVGWMPIRDWTEAYDQNPSTVEDLVDQGLVPPWMDRITDRSARIRTKSKYESGWQWTTRRFSPSNVRMAFDSIAYNRPAYGGFHPAIARHLIRGRPTGANVLSGDGHVQWRPFEKMKERVQSSDTDGIIHAQYY